MNGNIGKKHSGLILVKAEIQDAEMISEIEKKSFSSPWSIDFITRWIQGDTSGFLLARSRSVLLGYIGFRAVLEVAEIDTLAVHPDFKRQGVGNEMIRFFLQEQKKKRIEQVFLEVRETNGSAIVLYQKNGFTQVGVRKDYYQDTGEAALLMQCRLFNQAENIS